VISAKALCQGGNNRGSSIDYFGMKKAFLTVIVSLFGTLGTAAAQERPAKHEIGLTLGGLLSTQRSSGPTRLDLGSGVALQANYGYRFFGGRKAALYGEVHMLASPLREVTSANQSLTRDAATLFVTPGIRVKFNGTGFFSPYVVAGGGWALYEQSTMTLGGNPNSAPRTTNHGTFVYGGGVDTKFWRFVGLRAEIRDFYAGGPAYNTTLIRGGQHNVVAGGGLVLKFR
jgi:opacity protein-like surface antigen